MIEKNNKFSIKATIFIIIGIFIFGVSYNGARACTGAVVDTICKFRISQFLYDVVLLSSFIYSFLGIIIMLFNKTFFRKNHLLKSAIAVTIFLCIILYILLLVNCMNTRSCYY